MPSSALLCDGKKASVAATAAAMTKRFMILLPFLVRIAADRQHCSVASPAAL
jgi:hypothetical protein